MIIIYFKNNKKIMSEALGNNIDFENRKLNLKEVDKELREIHKKSKSELNTLKKEIIEQKLFKVLNSEKWLKIVAWDQLNYLKSITSEWNRITFNNEADKIWPGDTITIENKTVFREHNWEKVKVWVVSSGFEKSEVQIPLPQKKVVWAKKNKNEDEKGLEESLKEKEKLEKIKKFRKKTLEEAIKIKDTSIKNEVLKKLDECKDKSCLDEISQKIKGILEKEKVKPKRKIDTILDFKEQEAKKSILWNWTDYKAGETLVENTTYEKFEKELLEKTSDPKLKMIIALSQIWIDGARKEIPKQWSLMWMRDDKKALGEWISWVTEYINKIINITLDKTKDIRDIDWYIELIFTRINEAQKDWEEILDEANDIRVLINKTNSNNYKENLAKMLELSAWWIITDWNTEKSKEIARDIIINENFLEAKKSINKINDIDSLKINYFTSNPFQLNENQAKEIIEEIKDTYTKTKAETEKQREIIIHNFKKQNPNFEWNVKDEVNKIIGKSAEIQAFKMAEEIFVDYKIDSIKNNKIADTYKDLNSNWQASKDFLAENWAMIALSLIPMWVWFAAVWLAAKWASIVMRWATLANYWRWVQIARNSAKWVIFYEWMNITNNAIYQDKFGVELLNGYNDPKELIKSALFFNIMWIVGKFTQPWAKTISAHSMKSIIAEVWLFTWVDLWVELWFGEEMTMEQFTNSLITWGLMTIMSRWAWKLTNWYARGSKIDKKAPKLKTQDYKWSTENPQKTSQLFKWKEWKSSEIKSSKIDKLSGNKTIEVKWKNWDNYKIKTDAKWTITEVFNITKNKEINWWAKKSWIKFNTERIKETKIKTYEAPKKWSDKDNIISNKNIENISKKIDVKKVSSDIFEHIKKSPKILKQIDEKLSNLPYFLNKPYDWTKWIVNTSWNDIKTPYTIMSNMKNSKWFKQHSKNILFADKDISFSKWILKVWTIGILPTTIEWIINYQNNNWEWISLTFEEFVKEVWWDYLSYMYLWIINSIILEIINSEKKDEEIEKSK